MSKEWSLIWTNLISLHKVCFVLSFEIIQWFCLKKLCMMFFTRSQKSVAVQQDTDYIAVAMNEMIIL